MKLNIDWLRELVNPSVSNKTLADQLTLMGLEVDSIEAVAGRFEHVVVAEVTELAPHPDADKLKVCQVTTGDSQYQIVCGAPNVVQGGRYPLAQLGTHFHDLGEGLKIKKAKLRGVESQGMLCSAAELGLAEKSAGLLSLPEDAPLGQSIRDYLKLDDQIIELDLTPNRSDCLSAMGLAREVAVANQMTLKLPEYLQSTPEIEATDGLGRIQVEVDNTEACPLYSGRVIRSINTQASTPLWLQERLRRCGIKAIHPVVDIANYVMLECGQPLHAFDLDKLSGNLQIRMARPEEKLTLLDDSTVSLRSDTLVIADAAQALVIAGIMGGQDSAVSEHTSDIFLESAHFSPDYMAGQARSYGLHTDSSHRYERGVDPTLPLKALEKATQLILSICGGQSEPVVVQGKTDWSPTSITLSHERVSHLLGVTIDAETVVNTLSRLGFEIQGQNPWQVTAPPRRFDIKQDVDLIEEIARVYGYDRLPRQLTPTPAQIKPVPENKQGLVSIKQQLVHRGYQEVITYSFVDPAVQTLLNNSEAVTLKNPISSELSVMRTSLLPGLINVLQHNINRQQKDVRIFEQGLCFFQNQDVQQTAYLGGLIYGSAVTQWSLSERRLDFYDLKADIEYLFAGQVLRFVTSDLPAFLHPGQAAIIQQGNQTVGFIGALHPRLSKPLGLDHTAYVFQVETQAFQSLNVASFSPLSKFPPVKRDFALVVDEAIEWNAVEQVIYDTLGETLKSVKLFDIYTGEAVTAGRKSFAISLILQEFSRTLNDQEIETMTDNLLGKLHQKLDATLRE